MGVRKPGLVAAKFLKSVETHLRVSDLPEARPEGLETAVVMIEPPADRTGRLADQYSFSVYRGGDSRGGAQREIFPPLSPEIFSKIKSHCVDATEASSTADFVLRPETLYDLLGASVDWRKGRTRIALGTRREQVHAGDFLWRLTRYAQLALTGFKNRGPDGFLIYATAQHALLITHWPDQKEFDELSASEEGKAAQADLDAALEPTVSEWAMVFPGKLAPGKPYQMGSSWPKADHH